MKVLKVVACMLLLFTLTLSLVSCGIGDKINVDKDGNVKIKGEDGDVVIGKTKWDKSKMHGLDAPKAKLESSISTDDGTMYGLSEMKEKDAKAYIEKIKDAGFTYNSLTIDDYSYTGTDKEGLTISFVYTQDTSGGTIISGKGEPPTDEDDQDGAIIGNSDQEWDGEKMGGLPDPGVGIQAFWTSDGDTNYTLDAIPSYEEYVDKIKDGGFTIDVQETDMDGLYIYIASNSEGERITFSASDESSTIFYEENIN